MTSEQFHIEQPVRSTWQLVAFMRYLIISRMCVYRHSGLKALRWSALTKADLQRRNRRCNLVKVALTEAMQLREECVGKSDQYPTVVVSVH